MQPVWKMRRNLPVQGHCGSLAKRCCPFHELCHSCGGCMEVCPENAITETGRELGVIERGTETDWNLCMGG